MFIISYLWESNNIYPLIFDYIWYDNLWTNILSYWTKGSYWLSWCQHFDSFTVATMTWLIVTNICVTNDHGYVLLVVSTPRSFPRSRLITGFVTRETRLVPLVEQELLILPEHLSWPPTFSGVRVSRFLFVGYVL